MGGQVTGLEGHIKMSAQRGMLEGKSETLNLPSGPRGECGPRDARTV